MNFELYLSAEDDSIEALDDAAFEREAHVVIVWVAYLIEPRT